MFREFSLFHKTSKQFNLYCIAFYATFIDMSDYAILYLQPLLLVGTSGENSQFKYLKHNHTVIFRLTQARCSLIQKLNSLPTQTFIQKICYLLIIPQTVHLTNKHIISYIALYLIHLFLILALLSYLTPPPPVWVSVCIWMVSSVP